MTTIEILTLTVGTSINLVTLVGVYWQLVRRIDTTDHTALQIQKSFEIHENEKEAEIYGIQQNISKSQECIAAINREVLQQRKDFEKHERGNERAYDRLDTKLTEFMNKLFTPAGKSFFVPREEFEAYHVTLTNHFDKQHETMVKMIESSGEIAKTYYERSSKERQSIRDEFGTLKRDISLIQDRAGRAAGQ